MTRDYDFALAVEDAVNTATSRHSGVVAGLEGKIARQEEELEILRARVRAQREEIARLLGQGLIHDS